MKESEEHRAALRADTERREKEGLPPRPGSFAAWKAKKQDTTEGVGV